RARIVLPADFEARYRDDERALILAHERIHLARRDVLGNALLAALCSAYWFNPLAWIAADRFRRDQELACDESVVARNPHARRAYGEAMVKTQLSAMPAPLACHWFGGHPVKERIAMLKRPVPGKRRVSIGLAVAALVVTGGSFAAWAARPPVTTVAGASQAAPAAGAAASEPASRTITLTATRQPAREVVLEAARLAGLHVVDPQAVPEKPLTLQFADMDAGIVMQMIAEECGLVASIDGDSVSFRARTDAQSPLAPAGRQADRDAHVDDPSRWLAPPKYPADAAANKVTGKVVVIVDVAADGSVADARVEKSEPAGVFDQATLVAVKQWKFQPAIKDGKAVAGRVRVPVNFDMDAPEDAASDGKA
ncbi:MAG TPA: TonB family protein, partial [Luteimonas sp.]|nr:TonB family protein [Luteimonas sp.]